jgi:diguanylate cyclase (GGDEF)-like protein
MAWPALLMSRSEFTRRDRFDAPIAVLIADDDLDRQRKYADAFAEGRRDQFRVICASSLTAALEQMRTHGIDALVLDRRAFAGHGQMLLAEASRHSDRWSIIYLAKADDIDPHLNLDVHEVLDPDHMNASELARVTRVVVQQQRMLLALAAAETHALHRTLHDSLTGLANRAMLLDRIDRAMARSADGTGYALLFIDLDRFKVINDSLGHSIGDHILMEVAMRLTESVRESDTVARLAADEFMILLENVDESAVAMQIAEKIQARLSEVYTFEQRVFRLTASIGIALSDQKHEEPLDLVREADTAMHSAKAKGRASKVLFGQAMRDRAVLLFDVENELPRAIEAGQIAVFFQPIYELDGLRMTGCEALVRWLHPERGMISPLDFIPVAESTGLIGMLGQHVLNEACIQCAEWNRYHSDPNGLRVSVNVSPAQFRGWDVRQQVLQALAKSRLDPRNLAIEVTESIFIDNPKNTAETLQSIRDLGVSIYLDDFGTGYSSLSYLVNLPIDTIKVDRAFVKDLSTRPDYAKLTRGILTLAHELDFSVTAEGIETREQLDALRLLGCEYGQGYYFSKPIAANDFWRLISTPLAA